MQKPSTEEESRNVGEILSILSNNSVMEALGNTHHCWGNLQYFGGGLCTDLDQTMGICAAHLGPVETILTISYLIADICMEDGNLVKLQLLEKIKHL